MNTIESPVVVATEATFDHHVTAASRERTVLVDFWAAWCGPCKALAPILDQIATDHADRLQVVKVDVDADQHLASLHGVRALPTLMLFRGGRPVQQLVGLQSVEAIMAAVDRVDLSVS